MSGKVTQLHDFIVKSFSSPELKELCFLLEINYDDLAGGRISEKVQSLLLYAGDNDRLEALLKYIDQKRPTQLGLAGFSPDTPTIDALYDAWPEFLCR